MEILRDFETVYPGRSTCYTTPAFSFPTAVFPLFLSSFGWPVFRRFQEREPKPCSLCGGYRVVPCDVCSGVGKLVLNGQQSFQSKAGATLFVQRRKERARIWLLFYRILVVEKRLGVPLKYLFRFSKTESYGTVGGYV
ncbi:hypothetical protein Gasu2_49040 [Galdieria sulphuraria]|nr:hypothetical protein Gasu2_49040 [Galdieria sulphuraria]